MSVSLVRAGEDALQRNAEAEREERLHVEVRLTAARVGHGCRVESGEVVSRPVDIGSGGEDCVRGVDRIADVRGCLCDVRMRWDLSDAQGMRLLAAAFAEGVSTAHMDWGAGAQIGEGKVHASIAAESC